LVGVLEDVIGAGSDPSRSFCRKTPAAARDQCRLRRGRWRLHVGGGAEWRVRCL